MTFDAFETSREAGQVLELYTFIQGPETDRFTSFNRDVTWNGLDYSAIPISRTETQSSVEDAINQVTLTVALDNTIARRFLLTVPGRKISVMITRAHFPDVAEEQVVVFRGFVANVTFDGELEAKILCQPDTNIFKRAAPRFSFQGLCNHILYDQRCKVIQANFTYTDQVTAVSGNDITVNGLSANGADWAVGGYVQAPAGGNDDARMILAQSGDTVTLLLPLSISVIGNDIDVFAGCAHDIVTCDTKFSNVPNYGGFAFVPGKNPFNITLRGGR